jgi:uncharacterized protein
MIDLLLIMTLGFLGSFGHCAGMCSPIAVAFSLSQRSDTPNSWWRQVYFHVMLNLGRILSYALVGAGIGAIGSVLIAGGQMAGVGSGLRRAIAIFTGIMLIWVGLVQIGWLPRMPLLHPFMRKQLHDRFSSVMVKLSMRSQWWTPLMLGSVWGLIPCGFLYTAQIKAAETGNVWEGSLTMLAFGVGTLPTMLGIGISAAMVSVDRRSQLFRLGGWITLTIGILLLLRTGDTMTDYTGHAALICLILALMARPISRIWSAPLRYRRGLGVGAFVLSLAHTAHMMDHTWGWKLGAIAFMLPQHQWGTALGMMGLVLLAPAALTSFDWAQVRMGRWWRSLHLLTVPALIAIAAHCILLGSHYLGRLQLTWVNQVQTVGLVLVVLTVLAVRSSWFWSSLGLDKYVPPAKAPPKTPAKTH